MSDDIQNYPCVPEIDNQESFEWLEQESKLFSMVVENLLSEEDNLNSLKELIETMQEEECLISEEFDISDSGQSLEIFPEWEEEKKALLETLDALSSEFEFGIDDELSQLVENNTDMVS